MASTFPTTIDTLTDGVSTSYLNNPDHTTIHNDANDAVEKLEAKVGADSSAVTTSHDYKLSGVTGSDKAVSLIGSETLTNKRVTVRVSTEASNATPTPASDSIDMHTITALAEAAAFAVPSGTPTEGQSLVIRIKDNATARALTWNAIYRAGDDIALPSTTVISKTMYLSFIFNNTDTKWDLVGTVNNI